MKPGQRLFVFLCASLLLVTGATAQVDNIIDVNATGGGSSITIDIDLDIGGNLPASWVGWVLVRTTIGVCEPAVRIGVVTPFEAGAHFYQRTDADVVSGLTYSYRVNAVDDQDALQNLGGPPLFPPGYYHDDFASLGGDGVVAEGYLTSQCFVACVIVCETGCWYPLHFISYLPPGLEPAVDSGIPVRISGTLDNEFEGPYISTVTDWSIIEDCGTVPVTHESWGALKALYR